MNKGSLSNFIPKLALGLLCLVLITSHFASGLYARYTGYAEGVTSARVASFRIETELDHVSLGLPEGQAPSFTLGGAEEISQVAIPFSIESGSEVSVGYSVIVEFPTALPDYLTLTLTDGTTTSTLSGNGADSSFSFLSLGALTPGDAQPQTASLTLTISVTDLSLITEEITIPTAAFTVRVYQVD